MKIFIALGYLSICIAISASAQQIQRNCRAPEKLTAEIALDNLRKNLQGHITDVDASCIAMSLDLLGASHDVNNVKILLPYLEFVRPLDPEESKGYSLHQRIQSYQYPAIAALVNQGQPANPLLMNDLKTDKQTELHYRNAVQTLIYLNFEHPEMLLADLSKARVQSSARADKRLSQAIQTVLASDRCKSYPERCAKAITADSK